MTTKRITIIPFPAYGKPTMTRRDKWEKRKCVMTYRSFCDRVRDYAGAVPEAHLVETVRIIANFAPPASISEKKRRSMLGKRKRTKPDGDNIIKAISDALWADDHQLGGVSCDRYWAERDETILEITLVDQGEQVG